MDNKSISALILSGGRGHRMGGADKGLMSWQDKPLIEHIINTLKKQVGQILLSCNRNIETYQTYGLPVINDQIPNFQGPLSGILATLNSGLCTGELLLICPCDCPTLPDGLAENLFRQKREKNLDCIYVYDGERDQYLLALISTNCKNSLEKYISTGGRSVKGWYKTLNCGRAEFSDIKSHFLNLNTCSELKK